MLRIPTGREFIGWPSQIRRLTSWLFRKREGVEFGTTEDNSIQWQGAGLEPGTFGLQVQHPNHEATLPPLRITCCCCVVLVLYLKEKKRRELTQTEVCVGKYVSIYLWIRCVFKKKKMYETFKINKIQKRIRRYITIDVNYWSTLTILKERNQS